MRPVPSCVNCVYQSLFAPVSAPPSDSCTETILRNLTAPEIAPDFKGISHLFSWLKSVLIDECYCPRTHPGNPNPNRYRAATALVGPKRREFFNHGLKI